MNEETLQLLKGSGYDTSKIPSQLSPQQPSQQDQNVEEYSVDDPRFVQDLIDTHSPEAAEALWSKTVGWDRVGASVDREVLAMKAANPKLPGGMFTSIGESRKAELKAQAPGLAALEEAKRRLTDVASTMKSNFDKFSPELQAIVGQDVASGKPFTKAVADRLPQHLELLSVKQAKDNSVLPKIAMGSGGSSSSSTATESGGVTGVEKGAAGAWRSQTIIDELNADPSVRQEYVNGALRKLAVRAPEGDRKDPNVEAQFQDYAAKKAEGEDQISLIREGKLKGYSYATGNNVLEQADKAARSKERLVVAMPDGSHQLKEFSDPDTARDWVEAEYFPMQSELKKKQLAEQEKAQNKADEPWLPRGVARVLGTDSEKELDSRIFQTEKIIYDEKASESDKIKAELALAELKSAKEKVSKEEKKVDQYQLLQNAQDQGTGFLFGLVLGVVFLLLVRPKGKSKFPKQVAFRLMAWGLILVIAMETSRFWVKGDFVAFIDAILRTSINAGLLWVIGYGFGWVKFYLIRRKKDGPSGAALTREEFSVANSSANQGDPQAQYQLALCYFHGQGVVKNTIEAYKWVLLAQANGIPEARGLCSQIEKKLSNEEILKGQARASEFVSEQAPELGTNEIT